MKKYEYKVIKINKREDEKERILNEHGKEGWELVSVYGNTHYLKRVIN